MRLASALSGALGLVELRVSRSRAGAESLPGFRWLMDVQGEGGHYSFTDNTSLLTDLCSPSTSDKTVSVMDHDDCFSFCYVVRQRFLAQKTV